MLVWNSYVSYLYTGMYTHNIFMYLIVIENLIKKMEKERNNL